MNRPGAAANDEAQRPQHEEEGARPHVVMVARSESTSALARALWTSAGTLFLGIGIAGIILPMLPGAVFLLIASACYVRGSARLHHWLMNHRVLGNHVRVMMGDAKMPVRAKVIAISAIWIAVGFSLTRTSLLPLQVVLVVLAIIGTWFITTRR
jgi:uncharacterized membrane protein YbaN (DUF454 family)